MFNFQPKSSTEKWAVNRLKQTKEASELFGREIFYLRPNEISNDVIWGESISREFLAANSHSMWITRDNDTMFDGNEDFGGFGYMPEYNSIIFIPALYFTEDYNFEPIEDDLIYFKDEKIMFQISKVNTSTEDYNGDTVNGKRFNYKFYLKTYQASDDDFTNFENTDIPEIEGLDDADLDILNATLTADITTINPVTIDANNPFGDLT